MHETFNLSGNSPSLMEMLNSSVTAGVILNAVSLSILAEFSSCPLALVVSSVYSRLYTYLFCTECSELNIVRRHSTDLVNRCHIEVLNAFFHDCQA